MDNNKELLEATVKGLEEKIQQLNTDLKSKQKELEDVNKPEITSVQMDAINDAVNTVLETYEFDCGMFEYEFNLGYDNKLELSDLTFNDHYNLAEAVMKSIDNHFKIESND